ISRGFHITIIHTHFNSPNPSNYPQFSLISIQDGLLQNETSTEDVVSLLTILNARCAGVDSHRLFQLIHPLLFILFQQTNYGTSLISHWLVLILTDFSN
ncbi:UDP-glycosyltransferase 76C4, partial [Linum perenne]